MCLGWSLPGKCPLLRTRIQTMKRSRVGGLGRSAVIQATLWIVADPQPNVSQINITGRKIQNRESEYLEVGNRFRTSAADLNCFLI